MANVSGSRHHVTSLTAPKLHHLGSGLFYANRNKPRRVKFGPLCCFSSGWNLIPPVIQEQTGCESAMRRPRSQVKAFPAPLRVDSVDATAFLGLMESSGTLNFDLTIKCA